MLLIEPLKENNNLNVIFNINYNWLRAETSVAVVKFNTYQCFALIIFTNLNFVSDITYQAPFRLA